MQILKDGPEIPEELLRAQEDGDVVCGVLRRCGYFEGDGHAGGAPLGDAVADRLKYKRFK